jgi:hypothetical protein
MRWTAAITSCCPGQTPSRIGSWLEHGVLIRHRRLHRSTCRHYAGPYIASLHRDRWPCNNICHGAHTEQLRNVQSTFECLYNSDFKAMHCMPVGPKIAASRPECPIRKQRETDHAYVRLVYRLTLGDRCGIVNGRVPRSGGGLRLSHLATGHMPSRSAISKHTHRARGRPAGLYGHEKTYVRPAILTASSSECVLRSPNTD